MNRCVCVRFGILSDESKVDVTRQVVVSLILCTLLLVSDLDSVDIVSLVKAYQVSWLNGREKIQHNLADVLARCCQ